MHAIAVGCADLQASKLCALFLLNFRHALGLGSKLLPGLFATLAVRVGCS